MTSIVSLSKIKFVRIIVSLTLTLSTFYLLTLRYFSDIQLLRGRMTVELMPITNILLFFSIALLIIRDIVSIKALYREVVSIILFIVSSLYSFLGSLIDISRLMPQSFIYIPPAFILIECSVKPSCGTFGALTISIPLGISFTIFIYIVYEIFVTYRTRTIEQTSEIIGGRDFQNIHNNVG